MNEHAIAIVGASIRAPGARTLAEYWDLLKDCREGIRDLTVDEVSSYGDGAAGQGASFVPRAGVLDDVELFDADYFGLTSREAQLADPQQRHLLEVAVEALEDGGVDPGRRDTNVGVFAGIGRSSYFLHHLASQRDLLRAMGRQVALLNDKDYAATQISYRLNLKGPSFTVATACSTSLLSVHLAASSLLAGECDVALAGGASINVLERGGYYHQEGNIYSSDGRCRPYDADASGTVGGSGVGLVCLKRLDDALANKDRIRAVILASAVNNDGGSKVGITAPSIEGQAAVVREAIELSGASPSEIGFVEGHGTATSMGDPIEVRALAEAFGDDAPRGACALGSVKGNVGHLDTAAGVAGLIKAMLAVEYGRVPGTLHFRRPNPALELEGTPFFVAAQSQEWPIRGIRRAGVSSFGMGGTNVHLVLEQAPLVAEHAEPASSDEPALWVVSGNSVGAVERARAGLEAQFDTGDQPKVHDVADALMRRRQHRTWRSYVVGRSGTELRQRLSASEVQKVQTDPSVAMMFSGQGSQYPRMVLRLSELYPTLRRAIDRIVELVETHGVDVRSALVSDDPKRLEKTLFTQPALFAVQWALAELWEHFGVRPNAYAGHSIGELVAATRAGVFCVEDAVSVVCARASAMQKMEPGSMLAVSLDEREARELLRAELWLAAVNAPRSVTISGTDAAIRRLEKTLQERNVRFRRLPTSHAFHSGLLEPRLAEYREALLGVTLCPPQQPVVSNVTGEWLSASQATDPEYWIQQARSAVLWSAGLETLGDDRNTILLDVGPGRVVGRLAARHPKTRVLPQAFGGASAADGEHEALLNALGRLWQRGCSIDWDAVCQSELRRHVSLPTYSFDRNRYWIERARPTTDVRRGRYEKVAWKQSDPVEGGLVDTAGDVVYVFHGESDVLAEGLLRRWGAQSERVVSVRVGSEFHHDGAGQYSIRPLDPSDLLKVFEEHRGGSAVIVVCWSFDGWAEAGERGGVLAIAALAKALRAASFGSVQLLTLGVEHSETPEEPIGIRAMGDVAALSLSKELSNVRCATVGVAPDVSADWVCDALRKEIACELPTRRLALRGTSRFVPSLQTVAENEISPPSTGATIVITGGLGGVGLQVATALRRDHDARIVLVSRSGEIADGTDSSTRHALLELLANDPCVELVQADVCIPAELSRVEVAVAKLGKTVEGVIHAAGRAGGRRLEELASGELEATLAPKVEGSRNVVHLAGSLEAKWVVLCGSVASLDGVAAQADYAAANAFLPAYATSLAKSKPQVLAVDWDSWGGAGMAARAIGRNSAPQLEVNSALTSLWAALAGQESHIVVRAHRDSVQTASAPTSSKPARQASNRSRRREVMNMIRDVWAQLLGTSSIGLDDNFFDLGGDSLLLVEVHRQLEQSFPGRLTIAALFEYPTPSSLAEVLCRGEASHLEATPVDQQPRSGASKDVAIIATACRVPGADSPDQLWSNLLGGVESIERLNGEDLARLGLDEETIRTRDLVPVDATVEGIEDFDASFFGMTPREAELLDPQQRLLMSCTHETLEKAGYRKPRAGRRVGVFCGTAMSGYLLHHLLPASSDEVDPLAAVLGNDKDFAASNLAYRFDLRGPAVAVNSACSTSLVAVAQACRALVAGDCELALAGGARIRVPQGQPYRYKRGGISSPDGRCRAFDHRAAGTVFGSGAGVVLLKPLERAVEDGDRILAVIKGSAVNNDGSVKMGITAPSVDGQAEVLRQAYANAEVSPDTVGFIEAHGTGTSLGDPIEVEAVRRVFGSSPGKSCALGSAKANIGHLDAAAGVIGLIKAAYTVNRGLIPPLINFESPNSELRIEESPLFFNTEVSAWPQEEGPRRAGVSSFGLGGTNVHVVLEQYVSNEAEETRTDTMQIVPVSATDSESLRVLVERTEEALRDDDARLVDVAGSWQVGRLERSIRRAYVARSRQELASDLRRPEPGTVAGDPTVVMVFAEKNLVTPSSSSIEQRFEVYRRAFERCMVAAQGRLELSETTRFACGFAYAELWKSLGVTAEVVVGNGVGELVAATTLGILCVEEALDVLVRLQSVKNDVASEALKVFAAMKLRRPAGKMLRADGTWLTAEEAVDPSYWARRVTEFSASEHASRGLDELDELDGLDDALFVSVGSNTVGRTLRSAASAQVTERHDGHEDLGEDAELHRLLIAVGRCWERGLDVDWTALRDVERWRRVPLPAHPLKPRRHWIEAPGQPGTANVGQEAAPAARAERHPRPALSVPFRAPEKPRERALADIWARCLRIEVVGLDDDFFELGGDSLLAVQLADLICRELGVEVGSDSLLRVATVRQLAEVLAASQQTPQGRNIVTMREGTGRPIVVVHPIGGHVYSYRELVGVLDTPRPVVAIKARGLEAGEEPIGSVRDMAVAYLEQLRAEEISQMSVLGASFGGLVAYEMASQLESRGERTPVYLLDTPGPGHMPPRLTNDAALLSSLVHSLGIDELSANALSTIPRNELAHVFLKRLASADVNGPLESTEMVERILSILRSHQRAMFEFSPHVIGSPVHYFLAATRRPGVDPLTPHEGWESLLKNRGLTTRVAGDHNTMLQSPNVEALGEILSVKFRSERS